MWSKLLFEPAVVLQVFGVMFKCLTIWTSRWCQQWTWAWLWTYWYEHMNATFKRTKNTPSNIHVQTFTFIFCQHYYRILLQATRISSLMDLYQAKHSGNIYLWSRIYGLGRVLRENLVSTSTTFHGHRYHYQSARRDRLARIGRFACHYQIVKQYTTLHRQVRHSYSASRCNTLTVHIPTTSLLKPQRIRYNGETDSTQLLNPVQEHTPTTVQPSELWLYFWPLF